VNPYIKAAEVELFFEGEGVGVLVAGYFGVIFLADPFEVLSDGLRGSQQPLFFLPGHFGDEVKIEA